MKVPGIGNMREITKNAERLNNYMRSVDDDLKKIRDTFNANFGLLGKALEGFEKRLEGIERVLDANAEALNSVLKKLGEKDE